jgi:hypothetical protein
MRTRPFSSPPTGLRPILLSLSLLTLASLAAPAAAQLSIGARAATTGLGAELSFPLGGVLRGRLAAGTGSYGLEFDSTRVTYEGDAELRSLLAIVDLYPAGGGFRLSGGALLNDNRLEGDAPVRDVLLDNGIAVPPSLDLGTLHAEATGDEVAPYAGLGWDRGPNGRGGWHVSIDAGVAYHGEPDVHLELATPIAIPAAVLRELMEQEERDLEEELADYRYLPVVAVSLAYRF